MPDLDVHSLKVTELKAELGKLGLSQKGLKKELVERLEEALSATKEQDVKANEQDDETKADEVQNAEGSESKSTETPSAELGVTASGKDDDPVLVVDLVGDMPAPKDEVNHEKPQEILPEVVESAAVTPIASRTVEEEVKEEEVEMDIETEDVVDAAPAADLKRKIDGQNEMLEYDEGNPPAKRLKTEDAKVPLESNSPQDKLKNKEETTKTATKEEADTSQVEESTQSALATNSRLQPSSKTGNPEPVSFKRAASKLNSSTNVKGTKQSNGKNHAHNNETSQSSEQKPVQDQERKAVPKQHATEFPEQLPPSVYPPSRTLYVSGFVRPVQVVATRELMIKYGPLVPEESDEVTFFMDGVRSHAYVTFENESSAFKAASALHDMQYPAGTGRRLHVAFVDPTESSRLVREEDEAWKSGRNKLTLEINDIEGKYTFDLRPVGQPVAGGVPRIHVPGSAALPVASSSDCPAPSKVLTNIGATTTSFDENVASVPKAMPGRFQSSQVNKPVSIPFPERAVINPEFKKTKAEPSVYYCTMTR